VPTEVERLSGFSDSTSVLTPEQETVKAESDHLFASPYRVLAQAAKRYVLVESSAGLIIIDQHAAHERIIYERFRRDLLNNKMEIQTLLAPINLDLDPRTADLLSRKIPIFREIGIEIEPFGNDSFIITGLPAILSGWNREELVLEVIDELDDEGKKQVDPREEIKIRMACLAAVKARAKLDPVELTRLVEELLACEDPDHCPHGRPTMIVDSWYELEKRFGRK